MYRHTTQRRRPPPSCCRATREIRPSTSPAPAGVAVRPSRPRRLAAVPAGRLRLQGLRAVLHLRTGTAFHFARPAVLLDELDSGLVDGRRWRRRGPADAPVLRRRAVSPTSPNAFRLLLRVVAGRARPPAGGAATGGGPGGWQRPWRRSSEAGGRRFLATWLIDPYGRPAPFGSRQDLHAAFVEAELDDGSRLLLQDARFEVAVSWHDPYNGGSGFGRRVRSATTAVLLVLPREQPGAAGEGARRPAGNGYWWVFYGGLSTVELTRSRSSDRQADRVRSYHKPPFVAGEPRRHRCLHWPTVDAAVRPWRLAGGAERPLPRASREPAGPCTEPDAAGDGRAARPLPARPLRGRGRVAGRRTSASRGTARACSLTPESGYLWFFNRDNAGAAGEGARRSARSTATCWIFSGALSNVVVQPWCVRDTVTSEERRFDNAGGFHSLRGNRRADPPPPAYGQAKAAVSWIGWKGSPWSLW